MKEKDWRYAPNGITIPVSKGYADQPFVVKTKDDAIVIVTTTGSGDEGKPGQGVVSIRSTDNIGKTWEEPVFIDGFGENEASYASVVRTNYGRIYVFYNYNSEGIRKVPILDDNHQDSYSKNGYTYRVDCLGDFVFKYSDDHGKSWSSNRYKVPVRQFEIDRCNSLGGKVCYFWNASKILVHENTVYIPHYKVGNFGYGFYTSSEGVLLKSSNLLSERDVNKLEWDTLPDGDVGISLWNKGNKISEEHSFNVLSDGTFFVNFRTIDGYVGCAYSYDKGKTWTKSEYMTLGNGRKVKNPRAANFVWKCSNGKFLYWFENNSSTWYENRNPAWLCGGYEIDTPRGKKIHWNDPVIFLYEDDPMVRMSYPDFFEKDGCYFLTETNKAEARLHEIPSDFLQALWDNEYYNYNNSLETLLAYDHLSKLQPMVKLPSFRVRVPENVKGESAANQVRLCIEFNLIGTQSLKEGMLFSTMNSQGVGMELSLNKKNEYSLNLSDGFTSTCILSDPLNKVPFSENNHIQIELDYAARIGFFRINGISCDGGEEKIAGWSRVPEQLTSINGSDEIEFFAPDQIKNFRIYIY